MEALLPSEGRGRRLGLALVVALVYLVPALYCLGDYGPTYDAIKGDYPYGERLLGYLETGNQRFLDLKQLEPQPERRMPHPNFDQDRFPTYFGSPVSGLLSAFSCRILWTELGWLPAMSAHNLPFVLLSAALVFVVTWFATSRFGALGGIVAGGALFLTPSFFGHSFNNPKDIPECFFYTVAVLAGLCALEGGARGAWLVAGAATGLALAQKANALFLPVQLAVFVAGLALHARLRRTSGPRLAPRGLLLTTVAFVLAYYAASPDFWSRPIAGPKLWIGQMMSAGNRAARGNGLAAEVSLDAVKAVLFTTPLAFLALAACGLARPGLEFRLRWFLLVSLLVPVGRNLAPGMRSYDGTRHFLEFLPILCLAAGAGAAWLVERARALRAPRGVASALAALLVLGPPAWAVIDAHPNQVAYFNALAGGLGGQQARHNPDASDFWGNSYWQGLAWLSEHAEPEARVLVLFKEHIARAGAPVRLRPDVRILNLKQAGAGELPFYVMSLVNKAAGPFVREIEGDLTPALEVRVQNGAVLRIYRVEDDERGRELVTLWQQDLEKSVLRGEVLDFLMQDKALMASVMAVLRAGLAPEARLARLAELLPPELFAKVSALNEIPEDAER